jgi:hypothetical protein
MLFLLPLPLSRTKSWQREETPRSSSASEIELISLEVMSYHEVDPLLGQIMGLN